MALSETAAPLLSLPSAADGVLVTPSGVTETFSAWFQMSAAIGSNIRLASIIALPGTRTLYNFYEVEIGTGALGAEVAVAAARGCSGLNSGGPADMGDVLTLGIPADVITSGQRVSCRLRQLSTAVDNWRISIQYWALPMTGTVPASTVGPVNVPAGSRTIVTSGASWASGAWVQVTASTDGAWTIGNVMVVGPNFQDWELDIGTGAAASEVVKWTVKSRESWFAFGNAWQGGPWNILMRPPLGPIANGTRVAVRMRNSGAANGYSAAFTVTKQTVAGVPTALVLSAVPSAANFQLVPAVSGGIFNFGAWTEFIASTATSIAVTGITTTSQDNTGDTIFQLGVGSAGNEVLFAEMFASFGVWGGGRFNLQLPYARILPASSRVSIRIAVAGLSSGLRHFMAMQYLNVPTAVDFNGATSTLIQQVYLNSSRQAFSLFSGVTAWTNGDWVEIDASVPEIRVITAYNWQNPAQMEYEVDLGVGAAGVETVVTTIRVASGCDPSGGSLAYDVLPIPAILSASARFSMRVRCSTAGVQTIKIAPHYTSVEVTPIPPEPPTPAAPTIERTKIRWLIRSPTVSDTGQRIFHQRLQVDMQTGSAQTTGEGSDPVVNMRMSDDAGYTWSNTQTASLGRIGQYKTRVQWFLLGSARDRVYELWSDDPTPESCIVQAFIDLEEGTW